MPHLIFEGLPDLRQINFPAEPLRRGRVVMKIEHSWLRSDGQAMLVEGVVVEFSRALHPVAVVSVSRGRISLGLWPHVPVERSEAVQRWLLMVAKYLRDAGAGAVKTSNLSPDLLAEFQLSL